MPVLVLVRVSLLLFPPGQRVAIAPAKSSGKQLPRRARRIKPAQAAATSGDEFFPRDYFFIQTIIAAMIPIALKIDIIPAGMILPVLRSLGAKRRQKALGSVVVEFDSASPEAAHHAPAMGRTKNSDRCFRHSLQDSEFHRLRDEMCRCVRQCCCNLRREGWQMLVHNIVDLR